MDRSIKYETTTGGFDTAIQLIDEGINYESHDLTAKIILSENAQILARVLFTYPNIPLYPKRIKSESVGQLMKVSDDYEDLISSCTESETGIDSHFLRLGRFGATTYSFITNTGDNDRVEYANSSILDIELSEYSDRRKARMQKPFINYIDIIKSGPSEDKYTTNRKVAGSLATVIMIGGISWYVLAKVRK